MTSVRGSFILCAALTLPAVAAAPGAGIASGREPVTLTLERGRRDAPKVALTFDGGNDAGDTARILDILAARGVSATFFLTGSFVRANPELVRRMAADGHEIGNHTWSHPHLTAWDRLHCHATLGGVDRAFVVRELETTARAFEAVTGSPMAPLWRAPYGEVNAEISRWARDAGWRHVGWSRDEAGGRHTLDSLDWVSDRSSRNYLSTAQIAARILSFDASGHGLNGGIVLLHLSSRRVDPSVTLLDSLVETLRDRGYDLVTVGEIERDLESAGGELSARLYR